MFAEYRLKIGLVALLVVSYCVLGVARVTTGSVDASSCTDTDVQAAIDSAIDGAAVHIPSGVCTWTKQVVLSKSVTLMGAGVDATTIIDDVQGLTTVARNAILLNTAPGKMYRISGFKIRSATVAKGGLVNGTIFVTGSGTTWRIDHMRFDRLDTRAIATSGSAYGVVDHNEFVLKSGMTSIQVEHPNWNNQQNGDGSWADDSHFGSDKFVFIESNEFRADPGQHGWIVDSISGGRWVARFNSVTNANISSHGTESSGRQRSLRAYEIYGNTFAHDSNRSTAIFLRGGTGVIHDNTVTGFTTLAQVANYRSWNSFLPNWPSCDGSTPYDQNDGVVYETGFHNGSPGSTQLVDSTKRWMVNNWSVGGYSVRNLNKHWGSYATSNTATTVSLQPQTHGAAQLWDPGDAYQILRVTACLDQIGRGRGGLLSGIPASPSIWPQQTLEPLYSWNNSLNGAVGTVTAQGHPHIKEGRDYYNGIVKPGYTPYRFPHPLVSGTGLSAPRNLRIVPQPSL